MRRHIVFEIQKLAHKAVNATENNYFYYQDLERLVNQFIYMSESRCLINIPRNYLKALIQILPNENIFSNIENRFRMLINNLSLDGLISVSLPHRKSIFAIYEKIIDGRLARSGGLGVDEKKDRAIRFVEILDNLISQNSLAIMFKDLARTRLIFSTAESFVFAYTLIKEKIFKFGFKLSEIRFVNIKLCEDKVILPDKIDLSEYFAVHFKMHGVEDLVCGAELQMRLAHNHWGPHILKVANGYLNKYLADNAEEVDYSIDRLGLGIT